MNARFPKLDATRPFGADLVVRPRRQQAKRRPASSALENFIGAAGFAGFVWVLLRAVQIAAN